MARQGRLRRFTTALLGGLLVAACGGRSVLDGGLGGAGGAGLSSTSSITGTSSTSTTSASGSSTKSTSGSTTTTTTTSTTITTSTGVRDIGVRLAALPGVVSVTEQASGWFGERNFELLFDQPEDHQHPEGKRFRQRLQLVHRSEAAPMVLFTSGYAIFSSPSYVSEPAELLEANQLEVEQRFFSPSRASSPDWSRLTIEQAAADHHAIVQAFKSLYRAKWLSTGGSKGGMTSIYHRRFYPDDVQATVAYVAPNSLTDGDLRYETFLQAVEPATCRSLAERLAVEVLKRRQAMAQRLEAQLVGGGSPMTRLSADRAVEDAATSFAFAFWQYAGVDACSSLPSDPSRATDGELWRTLEWINSPTSSTDDMLALFEPYLWQASTELGYPGGDLTMFAGLLRYADATIEPYFPSSPFAELQFRPGVMQSIQDWLSSQGERFLLVYGEKDPWTAGAFQLGAARDSLRFTVKDGTHGAELRELPTTEQARAYAALTAWMGVTVSPPPPVRLARPRALPPWVRVRGLRPPPVRASRR